MELKDMYYRALGALKLTALLSLAVILLPLAAYANGEGGPGGPAEPKDGCKPLGSWFGYQPATLEIWWLSTVTGQSASHGAIALEVPGFDPTLPVEGIPTFPDVVKFSTTRAVWNRTSGNTFEYTGLGIAVDALGQPHYIAKLTGAQTLSDECDTMFVHETFMQIYPPSANPFEDDPVIGPIPFPDHYGYRMEVDLPEIILP